MIWGDQTRFQNKHGFTNVPRYLDYVGISSKLYVQAVTVTAMLQKITINNCAISKSYILVCVLCPVSSWVGVSDDILLLMGPNQTSMCVMFHLDQVIDFWIFWFWPAGAIFST